MILRIAAGLARNPTPEHRWRRIAVSVSAAIFTLMVFAGTSVILMVQRETEREIKRIPLLAEKGSSQDILLLEGDDRWNGEWFEVNWIETTNDAKPVLPPGVKHLPERGQAVVSPALDQLASQYPDLAARYPKRLVIGREGIRNEAELFAYVRVPEGRTIAEDESAVRVRGFGPTDEKKSFFSSSSYSNSGVPIGAIFVGVMGFLFLPGFLVLVVGIAAASGVRDHRFEVLRWIGASRQMIAALSVVETMILALPSVVAITLLWSLAAPRLGWVPLVGHNVVRGDLGLPWQLLVAGSGICIAVVGILSAAVPAVRQRTGSANVRPNSSRVVVTPLRAVPLVFVFVALMLGTAFQGSLISSYLYISGMAVAVVGVPLVVPGVLRTVGGALGRRELVPASVTGRSLQWDPIRAFRPFMGMAALVVVALVGSMYIELANNVDNSPLSLGETQVVSIRWADPRPEDLARLSRTLDIGLGSV